MAQPRFSLSMLHPKYWLLWFAFGLWYLLSTLPYRVQLTLGKGLGWLLYRLAVRRRQIAVANITLCFPELSEEQVRERVKQVINSVGIAFFETGIAWFWPAKRLQRLYRLEGIEHLEQAKKDGVGVLLVAMHFTHTDIGGKLMGFSYSIDGSYRPHNNLVYDYVQRVGRERHSPDGEAISRDDVRAMVKSMRRGRVIWYAPDQDYGPKHSIFVPFFGVPAATVTATAQLARLGKARVIPFTQTRLPDGRGYRLTVHPPVEHFPSGDEYRDALLINQLVESLILQQPEQYLWVHRRFKTRPEGEPDLYAPFGVSKKRR